MPTINIECNYCGNEFRDVSYLDIDELITRCPECTNDACRNCGGKKHKDHHPDCWKDAYGEDDSK